MKKIRLRKWVFYTIIVINCFLALCLTAECEDLLTFIITKLVLTLILLFNNYVLFIFSDFFE